MFEVQRRAVKNIHACGLLRDGKSVIYLKKEVDNYGAEVENLLNYCYWRR